MKIYLAGPMRGYPRCNEYLFDRAAAALHLLGHVVFSPAENDRARYGCDFFDRFPTGNEAPEGFSLRDSLGDDLAWICQHAEAVALLPGWKKSKGVRAEKAAAEALGLAILYLDDQGFIMAADNLPHSYGFSHEAR